MPWRKFPPKCIHSHPHISTYLKLIKLYCTIGLAMCVFASGNFPSDTLWHPMLIRFNDKELGHWSFYNFARYRISLAAGSMKDQRKSSHELASKLHSRTDVVSAQCATWLTTTMILKQALIWAASPKVYQTQVETSTYSRRITGKYWGFLKRRYPQIIQNWTISVFKLKPIVWGIRILGNLHLNIIYIYLYIFHRHVDTPTSKTQPHLGQATTRVTPFVFICVYILYIYMILYIKNYI
jgi:hypothetical protein